MKGKKLVSILTAGALAATMAMPAMAADGGEVNVDVTTKTGILRVQVPTSLAVAVDQFETTDVGSQIYSEDFTITNMSEVNVKVNVTSTATIGTGVTLASKRADVATATGANGMAWLAVAARLDGSKYETNNKLADLNEASANVTTFAKSGTATTAAQTFYLAKSTANVSTATYKMMKPSADGKTDTSYAQFYKLTKKSFTANSEQDELDALLAENDVYVLASTTETDDAALTKTAKNATVGTLTYAGTNSYYTIADTATPVKDVKAAEVYAYAELAKASSGADAAFRYIGALSSNKEVWDATAVPTVKIAYTIQGLPQSTYDDAVNETGALVYGLYKGKVPATYSKISGVNWVSLNAKDGFAAAPTSVSVGGTELASGKYTFEKSGWIKLVDDPAAGDEILVVVNGTTYKATVPQS